MRASIADVVRSIRPADALEQAQRTATLAWIASGLPLCRINPPATPPQHLVAYFVVYDWQTQHVLLGDHIKAGLWLPSGGHVEPDEHPRATVVREAHEELQLTANFFFPQPIFLTITETIGSTAGHTDVSLWYVLHSDAHATLPYDAAEYHQIAWFPLAGLPLARTDPHLSRFAAKLVRMTAHLSQHHLPAS
jgi:8-oxo-dGTP diphosphatase